MVTATVELSYWVHCWVLLHGCFQTGAVVLSKWVFESSSGYKKYGPAAIRGDVMCAVHTPEHTKIDKNKPAMVAFREKGNA